MNRFLNVMLHLKILGLVNCSPIFAVSQIPLTPLEKEYPALQEYKLPIGFSYPPYKVMSFMANLRKRELIIVEVEEKKIPYIARINQVIQDVFPFKKAEYEVAGKFLDRGNSYINRSYQHFLLQDILFEGDNINCCYKIPKEEEEDIPYTVSNTCMKIFQKGTLNYRKAIYLLSPDLIDLELKRLKEDLPNLSPRILMADSLIKWMEFFSYVVDKLLERPEDSYLYDTAPPNSIYGHFLQQYYPDFLEEAVSFFARDDIQSFPLKEKKIALEGKKQFFSVCGKFLYCLDKKKWSEYPSTAYFLALYNGLFMENDYFSFFLKKIVLKNLPFESLALFYKAAVTINKYASKVADSELLQKTIEIARTARAVQTKEHQSFRKVRCEIFGSDFDARHILLEDYRFFHKEKLFFKIVPAISSHIEPFLLSENQNIWLDISEDIRFQFLTHFIESNALLKKGLDYYLSDNHLRSLLNTWIQSLQICIKNKHISEKSVIEFDNLATRFLDEASFKTCYFFCAQICNLDPKMNYFRFQYRLADLIQHIYKNCSNITAAFARYVKRPADPTVSTFIEGMRFHKEFAEEMSIYKKTHGPDPDLELQSRHNLTGHPQSAVLKIKEPLNDPLYSKQENSKPRSSEMKRKNPLADSLSCMKG
jgi:hypothetical protein